MQGSVYIYMKNYLRFNDEVSEVQQYVSKPEHKNSNFAGNVRKTLDFIRNASMETFFTQILDIKMPARLLVKSAKMPI